MGVGQLCASMCSAKKNTRLTLGVPIIIRLGKTKVARSGVDVTILR